MTPSVLPAMKMLRSHAQLPIHGHRNGWGMLGRSPAIGMSYLAFQKLWRLAGIDHSHVNGIDNKFCETNESVIASARECLTPMFDAPHPGRSEEHTSELQSLMRISYAVFCLKKKIKKTIAKT